MVGMDSGCPTKASISATIDGVACTQSGRARHPDEYGHAREVDRLEARSPCAALAQVFPDGCMRRCSNPFPGGGNSFSPWWWRARLLDAFSDSVVLVTMSAQHELTQERRVTESVNNN